MTMRINNEIQIRMNSKIVVYISIHEQPERGTVSTKNKLVAATTKTNPEWEVLYNSDLPVLLMNQRAVLVERTIHVTIFRMFDIKTEVEAGFWGRDKLSTMMHLLYDAPARKKNVHSGFVMYKTRGLET